ncbi:MAG TPA: hypothetical protein VH164_17815, partial [Ktedonobacteraceae bacterium]|nr:hypothetical protein [Ktedonobacteraceae bacterium]
MTSDSTLCLLNRKMFIGLFTPGPLPFTAFLCLAGILLLNTALRESALTGILFSQNSPVLGGSMATLRLDTTETAEDAATRETLFPIIIA